MWGKILSIWSDSGRWKLSLFCVHETPQNLSVQFKMGRGPFICLDRGVGKGVRIGEIGYRVRLLGLANIHTHRIHH
jgi:hypothetical protein